MIWFVVIASAVLLFVSTYFIFRPEDSGRSKKKSPGHSSEETIRRESTRVDESSPSVKNLRDRFEASEKKLYEKEGTSTHALFRVRCHWEGPKGTDDVQGIVHYVKIPVDPKSGRVPASLLRQHVAELTGKDAAHIHLRCNKAVEVAPNGDPKESELYWMGSNHGNNYIGDGVRKPTSNVRRHRAETLSNEQDLPFVPGQEIFVLAMLYDVAKPGEGTGPS